MSDTPPRRTVVGWLRINLSFMAIVISLVSMIVGGLVNATLRVSDAGHQLTDVSGTQDRFARDLTGLHANIVDIDRRLNDGTEHVNELRRARDGELAAMAQRIAVLEAQLRFLADRTPPPQIGVARR